MAASFPVGRCAALAAAACGVASAWVAVLDGARAARARVVEQGYDVLGFEHAARLVWREALAEHLASVVPLATAGIAGVALAVVGCSLRRRSGASLLFVAALFAALGVAVYLTALHASKGWVGVRDAVFAFGAVAGVAGVAVRRRGSAGPSSSEDVEARVLGECLAIAASAPCLVWAARDLPWRPASLEVWARLAVGVAAASVLARWLASWPDARATPRSSAARARKAALSALAALLPPLALVAWSRTLARPTLVASTPLNVLVIGLDTVRADATALRGEAPQGRDTTPRLREFAARSLDFESAVSQAPWTLPAFASMFTGRYPLEHGAHRITSRLPARETTLAEVLREAGYRTAAVTSHLYLDRRHGLDQGFEAFDASNALGHKAITSQRVTDLAIAELEGADGRPFFLFAHYFDPHYEYRDHPEHDWADGYDGWFKEQNDFENLLKIRHLIEAPEVEWMRALYHEEIAHTDAQVGRLLDWVRARGLEQNTVIVVVADHGEEFGERGAFGHTISLHEEQLAVPLLVFVPGVAPLRVRTVVETRALFDTLLEALGVGFERPRRSASLLDVAARERAAGGPDVAARAYSTVWLDDSKLSWGKRIRAASVREGPWKLIDDVTRGRKLLFDLDNDPLERRNVLLERPFEAGRLEALLEPWIKEQSALRRPSNRKDLDAPTEQALRALGYL